MCAGSWGFTRQSKALTTEHLFTSALPIFETSVQEGLVPLGFLLQSQIALPYEQLTRSQVGWPF